MSVDRGNWDIDEMGNELRSEADVSDRMGRRHLLGLTEALNTNRPCAACKIMRRRCAPECIFCPYFSPHEPQRFAAVHKVFGTGNVSKMLMEATVSQRANAANSLVYEAALRLKDPVYGGKGAVLALQQQVQAMEAELNAVRAELLKYKSRQNGNDIIPSYMALLYTEMVSVAVPAPLPLLPPPASFLSPMDNQPSSTTDGSCISNENM
ncbi:hypothetical protein IFM89_000700 [Coptis chinensis]|uniref:LOB domain-containing protein n=1 Tax=Coptis chinensis TaxID=261450 RepID=A0A835HCD7_9MAGN|nr:hypothetical protein IFM89_000700 [Coptis chinensis]